MQDKKVKTHEIYQELNSYPELSQEDIDNLYEEERITEKSYSLQLHELETKLKKLKGEDLSTEDRLLCSIFGDTCSSEEPDNKETIQELEEKIEELKKKASSFDEQLLSATTKRSRASRKYPSKELRDQVFLGTIGLARYYAKNYYYKVKQQYRFDYDDLFQIACEGLLSACHYYVPTGQATFRTYASKCIENRLKRTIRLTKRKKKKNVTLDEELDRMHILKSFLEKEVFKGYGKIFELESLDQNQALALHRLNKVILAYNQEVLNLGEPEKVWKRVCKKQDRERSFEKLQEVFSMFEHFFKEGEIQTLISDEDRELAYLLSEKKNYKKKDARAFTLFEYLELYIMRLYQIDLYLKTEKRLLEENYGILPEESAVLKEVNHFIKKVNTRPKLGETYSWSRPLEERTNFLKEYINQFGVNFVDQEEREEYLKHLDRTCQDKWKGVSIISDEEEDIFYDYGELFTDNYVGKIGPDDVLDLIETLEDCSNHLEREYLMAKEENLNRIIFCRGLELCYTDTNESRVCISGYAFQPGPDGYTLEEAFNILSGEIEALKTMVSNCNAVETELKKRREQVKEIVRDKNEEIFKRNQELKDKLRLYHVLVDCDRIKLQKWDSRILGEVKNYTQLIYCDDETLMGFVEKKRDLKGLPEKNLEDEVLMKQFLEDYSCALESLPPIQKKIWESWYDENGTQATTAKELSEILGIPKSKVYQEKEKGKILLRKNPILRAYYENPS